MPSDIHSILDRAREEDGAGNHSSALMNYRLFIERCPGDAQAWADYAGCLLAAGRLEDSLGACGAALEIAPGLEPAAINMAAALVGLERFREARDVYADLLGASPGRPDMALEMQKCLYRMGDAASMDPELLKALGSGPNGEDALNLLAAVYAARKDWKKFRECSLEFLEAKFKGEELACEKGKLDLRLGEFGEALRPAGGRPSARRGPPMGGALWGGEPFLGKTLLLHWEQGFGDTIMMLRYGRAAKALGGDVALSVQPELLDLARTCAGFDRVAADTAGLDYDLHLPLMSLPFVLVGANGSPAAAGVPYLGVPARVKNREAIAERLRVGRAGTAPGGIGRAGTAPDGIGCAGTAPDGLAGSGRKIGLVWAGSKSYGHDHIRSVPPDRLRPLAGCRGVAWYSMQRESPGFAPFEGAVPMADLMETFADTAFAIDSMDMVVTVDTSTAHLAGALGKPTKLMLPFRGEWRWMEDRGDSPWYPTIRIHRQAYGGDWSDVVAAVAEDIDKGE
jgi:tetratricopeptide (TPR) repeat protein